MATFIAILVGCILTSIFYMLYKMWDDDDDKPEFDIKQAGDNWIITPNDELNKTRRYAILTTEQYIRFEEWLIERKNGKFIDTFLYDIPHYKRELLFNGISNADFNRTTKEVVEL
jgi:hypothetical protein